uniref:Ig-like domain-containing protein n=1 Tax=Meloidogyne hapla TaxID=6305 RepID=A0A1I8BWF2_MELHA
MKENNLINLIFSFIFLIKIIKSESPPKWEWEPPALLEMPEDSSVDLHCPARGRPSPIIRWSFNAIPFYELSDDYNRRIQLNEGRLLRINYLQRDLDTGLYQCNATNIGGYLASSTYLNVLAFAPRFRHSSQRVWKVLRDSSVDLNCDVEAAPIAEVHWVDANDTNILPVPGKLEIFSNNTLRLHSLSSSDDGFYYCNVSNKYGLNRAMNRLEVFIPTFFAEIPQPSRITLDANSPNSDNLELRCKAISDNRLSIDYIWTKNGRPILNKNDENKIEIITEEDGTSILRLKHLSGHHTGRLECSAVTEVDVKSAAIDLFVRDVPERPELMRVDCSSGRHALLVWKKPSININGLPLTAFIVEARTEQNSENWEKVFEEYLGGEEETATGPRILHKTAIPLRPWANYTFRLIAINSHGSSQPSQPMPSPLECSSPPDVPFQNPLGVIAAGNEPDNLIISWQPLPRDRWNAPGLRYLVRYRRLDLKDGDWNEFIVEDPSANQTIIREQPTFRPYHVQVRAINSLGFSVLEPPIVEGWSGEDVPTESPKNLHLAEHHNYSFVTIEWEHLENSSIRGHFRGYRVNLYLF